ncbi:hypothetical protein BDQ17DRAFT_1381350 [Cyathus striatus]|nr:hypothetical protein BDQ17DRAFT_1381350 [Cyathus striatus]
MKWLYCNGGSCMFLRAIFHYSLLGPYYFALRAPEMQRPKYGRKRPFVVIVTYSASHPGLFTCLNLGWDTWSKEAMGTNRRKQKGVRLEAV